MAVKMKEIAIISYGMNTVTVNVVDYSLVHNEWILIQADDGKVYQTNVKNVLIIGEKVK